MKNAGLARDVRFSAMALSSDTNISFQYGLVQVCVLKQVIVDHLSDFPLSMLSKHQRAIKQ